MHNKSQLIMPTSAIKDDSFMQPYQHGQSVNETWFEDPYAQPMRFLDNGFPKLHHAHQPVAKMSF